MQHKLGKQKRFLLRFMHPPTYSESLHKGETFHVMQFVCRGHRKENLHKLDILKGERLQG